MINKILFVSAFSLFATILSLNTGYPKEITARYYRDSLFNTDTAVVFHPDTVPPADAMEVIKKVVHSLDTFNIKDVANLYTPNAVIADDEPPYSWNGPTAGIQWVNAVEKACKDNELTKLKGTIETINVCQQTVDNVYIIVPVTYVGTLPGRARFLSKGAFTFVLRMENGSWLIKSQAWMPRRGM